MCAELTPLGTKWSISNTSNEKKWKKRQGQEKIDADAGIKAQKRQT